MLTDTLRPNQRVTYRHDLLELDLPARVIRVTKRGVVIEFLKPIVATDDPVISGTRHLTHKQAETKLTRR